MVMIIFVISRGSNHSFAGHNTMPFAMIAKSQFINCEKITSSDNMRNGMVETGRSNAKWLLACIQLKR